MLNIELVHNNQESNFYRNLEFAIVQSRRFFFSVAFISDSAIQLLTDAFKYCESKGIKGKILTTNYMFGTNPNALKRLLEFSNIEVKVYNIESNKQKGFHTKGYIFENDENLKVMIGSSNLTSRAMKSNYEWNLSYISKDSDELASKVLAEFDTLWNLEDSVILTQEYVRKYEKDYNKNLISNRNQNEFVNQFIQFFKDYNDSELFGKITKYLEINVGEIQANIKDISLSEEIKPNRMQEIALEGLYKIRENGGNKGLIIAATGTGKTYLAAFDALQMNPRKLLFVVHREKILKDAMRTFKNVLPTINAGLYTGTSKEEDKDYIFASIQTLSRNDNLYNLAEDHFDYIVIDEAHRASAPTYLKVMNHFKPKFLLGMTATPERTDDNSIFKLFDYQIAAEIRLRDALEERMVAPFHYFGITDAKTDLTDIDVDKDIDLLTERLNVKARVDLIVENIIKYKHSGNKTKSLGFCAGINHANYMSEEFNKLGLYSVALTGATSQIDREAYISRLEDDNDPLSYIFTVDIFNEGIDIPTVNLVLMLRPTQSPIIFTQQLGRGLRLHPDKEYLTILDFIGQHNKTYMIPIALSGDINLDKDDLLVDTMTDFSNIPGEVFIRLDEISKDRILRQLEKFNFNHLNNLKELYFNLKKDTKRIPYLMDYDLDGLDPIRFIESYKSYVEFVMKVDDDISTVKQTIESDFISVIRFINGQLPLKRVYEAAILKHLIKTDHISTNEMFSFMYEYLNNPSRDDFDHAMNHLGLHLLGTTEKSKYHPLVEVNNDVVSRTAIFNKVLEHDYYLNVILDSINYGIYRYNHEFSRVQDMYPSFRLYQKYKTKELTQIMLYPKIFVIQQGLFRYKNNFFLLITLDKGDVKESIKYQDKFLNNHTFQWESPNNTRQLSETGQKLINHKTNNINIHLFVKKGGRSSNIYSKEYIYIGQADVLEYKNEKPIRFKFGLHNSVPNDIYLRLTKEYKFDEEN